MTKKEQIKQMIYFYDHRDNNNEYICEDGRKYVFNSPYCDRDFMIKQIKKNINDTQTIKVYKGVTQSALFLKEMENFRGKLKDLLKEENKRAFFNLLYNKIIHAPRYISFSSDPSFKLDYSSFCWACDTVPRAWL